MKLSSYKFPTIILTIFIIALVIPLAYLVFFNSKISVKNSAEFFTIEYKKSEDLEKKLDDWGLWDENGVRLLSEKVPHTISRIQIESTDERPNTFTYRYPITNEQGETADVLVSKLILDDNNIGRILVYFNTQVSRNFSSDELNLMLAHGVVRSLYINRSNSNPIGGTVDEATEFLTQYRGDPSRNPFSVSLQSDEKN